MKKDILMNYMIVIMSWILWLNNCTITGMLLIIIYSIYLLIRIKEINIWRMLCLTIVFLSIYKYLISLNNLILILPNINFEILLITFNSNLILEYLFLFKRKMLYQLLTIIIYIMLLFYTIGIILPDSWYIIINKNMIYLIITLIFFPYTLNISFVLFKKELKIEKNINNQYLILKILKSRN